MILLWSSLPILWGCSGIKTVERQTPEDFVAEKKEIENPGTEVSLKADRSKFKELRKDIPKEVQKQNDESAFILNLMREGSEHPNKVRQKRDRINRKIRKTFSKDIKRSRNDYTKAERKRRDEFRKAHKKEREAIKKRKDLDRDSRKSLYGDLDTKAKDFYSKEKESRKAFESDIRAQSKDFHGHMREQDRDFSTELRAYTKDYNARKKQLREFKKAQKKNKMIRYKNTKYPKNINKKSIGELKEFDDMSKVNGQSLSTEGE